MSMVKSRKSTLLASSAATAILLMYSSAAFAQETTELAEDEVVATGIRQSIADSLLVKKQSTSIVEAISAEDIGKLPDVSIADSLARLPGVTAQRVRGRAQQISIRGLGPDFSIALLNGREQVSAGNNRGIEFDQFPSELISQGVVYKTPDATLAATGVAGAVDLRTVRPLDHGERKINVSGKYVINDNGDLNPDFGANGYRLFGSYIDQSDDGNFGWSLGITHQSNPTQFFSRELKTAPGQTSQLADGTYYASDNPRTGVVSRDFKRTSVAGTLQFEPSDRFEATIDAYYSDFQDEGIFRGVETPIASWSGNNLVASTGGGDFVSSATYSPTAAILRTDTEGNSAEILSLGGNVNFYATEKLRLMADVSLSTLDKSDIDYESYAGTGQGILFGPNAANPALRAPMTYNTPANGAYSIDYGIDLTSPSNIFLTDPGGWGQVGFIKEPQIDDDLKQLRAEAGYDLDTGFIESVQAGILFTDRQKDFDSNENFIREGAGFTNGIAAVPGGTQSTDTGSIGLDIIAYDPSGLIDSGVYALEKATFDTEWTVEEEIITYYGMANINSDGAIPIRGNIGFQYIDVEQSSTAGNLFVEESYSDFLPSGNLSFEVKEDTFIRVGAAKSVTRPRMDQLRTGNTPGFNNLVCGDTNGDQIPDTFIPGATTGNLTCINIGGGNPLLRPYESTSFDVAFEKYFSAAGAISVALFSKSVDDYVVDSSEVIDSVSAATSILGADVVGANPEASMINVSGPINAEKAKLQGVEVALRLPFDEIFGDSVLEGFGVNAAYTYTDADLDFNGTVIDIPGYSKETASGEIYYENNGWRARLNARHRSGFRSEIQQFDGALLGADALSETVLDAQIGYEWDEGFLEGVSVNFEAYNITDEPFRTENDLDGNGPSDATFISRREDYGTTYNFTIAKKF